jgi:hypothetical protein
VWVELDALREREGLRRADPAVVSDDAKQRLAELGFHPKSGRPLKRVINWS